MLELLNRNGGHNLTYHRNRKKPRISYRKIKKKKKKTVRRLL